MITAKLPKPVKVVTKLIDEVSVVEVVEIIDRPNDRVVKCSYKLGRDIIGATLWSGDGYDEAGQYTDKDVAARLEEILAAEAADE